jgi:hypothetical protein
VSFVCFIFSWGVSCESLLLVRSQAFCSICFVIFFFLLRFLSLWGRRYCRRIARKEEKPAPWPWGMAHISHVCCCFCLSIVNVVLELLKTSNKCRLDTRGRHSVLANALGCLWTEEVLEMVLSYVGIGNIYALRRLHQMVGLGFRV